MKPKLPNKKSTLDQYITYYLGVVSSDFWIESIFECHWWKLISFAGSFPTYPNLS